VLLFGEGAGRVLVSLSPSNLSALMAVAGRFGVQVQVLGSVGGDRLVIAADGEGVHGPWIDVSVDALARVWRRERTGT
jgi:hypothetical protein